MEEGQRFWQAEGEGVKRFEGVLVAWQETFYSCKAEIEREEPEHVAGFAAGFLRMGLQRAVKGGFVFVEWAPNAKACFLTGDFNGWHKSACPCERNSDGLWSCFIPDIMGRPAIAHKARHKVVLHVEDNQTGEVREVFRVPAWATSVKAEGVTYNAIYRDPSLSYHWLYNSPPKPGSLLIYEAHVGMAGEEQRIHKFSEFRKNMLPHIKDLGYNAVQLMGVMEHSYYASFGYQITNFFAVSSRFGSPNKFKKLVDTAHSLGLLVILDVVHSHAASNTDDGLNFFDGSEGQYFHTGSRGIHPDWKTRLFNYSEKEVQRFLLSNLRWWVEEYKIDGFRFDAVTSMLYKNHGHQNWVYPDSYFSDNVDIDALVYLKQANEMLHNLYPNIITIAEEVSGMPGLCCRVEDGGIGFDDRMALGIPNLWSSLLSFRDEDWSMSKIVFELNNRRKNEGTVAYVECHDQSIQGGRTIAHHLFSSHIHETIGKGGGMDRTKELSPFIQRGMSLHKMIRLITFGMGGNSYLNFMGNEYGHPFWVDFPCARNSNSYEYSRRLWSICKDEQLRYVLLGKFDTAMLNLHKTYKCLDEEKIEIVLEDAVKKVIVFERGNLLWIFNWHPLHIAKLSLSLKKPAEYELVLDTDDGVYGGLGRSVLGGTLATSVEGLSYSLKVTLWPRSAKVFVARHKS